jgi:hypothetical protein
VHGRFVFVTDDRILWTGPPENALSFDDVLSVSEQPDHHRLRLTLRHRSVQLIAHVPSYHVWFVAGGDRYRSLPFTETRMVFSRDTTRALLAIREQLAARDVAVEVLPRVEHPRRDDRVAATRTPYTLSPRRRTVRLRRFGLRRRGALRGP